MRCLLLGFLLVFAGCRSQSPEALFEDYEQRLANVTGIELDPAQRVSVPAYPRPRDLVLEAPDLRVGVMDFLGLGRCGVLGKISERNSPLGRLQRESGRLLYELDLYRALTDCAERAGADHPDLSGFLAKLEALRYEKRRGLPVAYWNATFGAREFQIFFDTATAPLAMDETPAIAGFERPLRFFANLGRNLDAAPVMEPAEFEQHYFELQSAKTGGKLLQAMGIAEFHLNRAAALLEQAAGQGRICPMGRKTRQAEYAFNVFVKFYAGGVQPYVGRLHRTAGPLQEAVGALYGVQRAPTPSAFSAYYAATLDSAAENSLWRRFTSAITRHTKAWQGVLRPCGMMPAGPIDRP